MSTEIFAARMDELNHVAEHVPAEVLARRITQIVEEYLSAHGYPVIMDSLAECFGVYTEARFAHDHPDPERYGLLSEVTDTEPKSLGIEHYQRLAEERYDRIKQLETELEDALNPGVTVREESPAEPRPEPEIEPEAIPEPEVEVVPEPDPPLAAEDTKLCKRCGPGKGPKPLSEFYKHSGFSDGRDNRCKDCRSEMRSQKRASKVTPIARPQAETGAEASLCANGERCMAYDEDMPKPSPAILDKANPGPLCRRCQKRAGVA